jgi:hypothetical protein
MRQLVAYYAPGQIFVTDPVMNRNHVIFTGPWPWQITIIGADESFIRDVITVGESGSSRIKVLHLNFNCQSFIKLIKEATSSH